MSGRVYLLCLAAILLSLWIALPAFSQGALPASFAGWTATGETIRVVPANVDQFAGDNAALLREDGVVAAERRAYQMDQQVLTVTIYRMDDSSGAYGAFTFLRSDDMAAADFAPYAAVGRDRAVVLFGKTLVEVSGLRTASLADLQALMTQLRSSIPDAPYPTIGEHLPVRGRERNSERYLLGPVALSQALPLRSGDWVGFANGAEAVLARYRIGAREATLLLVAYPTRQMALKKLNDLGQWLPLNPTGEQGAQQSSGFASRSGPLLALVFGINSRATADALLGQIRYESQVTWNEPGFRATEPTMGEMLVSIFIGTGTLLLFALIAGIAFGGVRLLTKFLLPGKVFDRPNQVEILQLGLTSKPIEAKDFY